MKQLAPGLPSADAGAVPAFPADERQTGERSIERWRSAQRTHLSPLTVTRPEILYLPNTGDPRIILTQWKWKPLTSDGGDFEAFHKNVLT